MSSRSDDRAHRDVPRVGVDLGGTKIEAIALADDGTVLARLRKPTPAGDYEGTLDTVAELIGLIEPTTGHIERVGIGTPGALSATGLIKNSNSTVLIGRPLDRDLALRLGRIVRLENDANCFALSEAVDGAAAGLANVFGVILGTGVGGGLVLDGRLVSGRDHIAGEWGHNPLPWADSADAPAAHCYCGKSGCIETYLSGAGLARGYRRASGKDLSAERIASAAERGDAPALACLEQYADQLARGLATVINLLDPDAIVLGGGLSNIEHLYRIVPPLIARYAFSDRVTTPILKALHGDSSGVRGAAWLW